MAEIDLSCNLSSTSTLLGIQLKERVQTSQSRNTSGRLIRAYYGVSCTLNHRIKLSHDIQVECSESSESHWMSSAQYVRWRSSGWLVSQLSLYYGLVQSLTVSLEDQHSESHKERHCLVHGYGNPLHEFLVTFNRDASCASNTALCYHWTYGNIQLWC